MPARRGSNHCLYLSETCHVILYVTVSTNNNNIQLASYWFEVTEWRGRDNVAPFHSFQMGGERGEGEGEGEG